jgi:hypothetical protein
MNNHSRSALHLGRNLLSFKIKGMVELITHSSGGLNQFAVDRTLPGGYTVPRKPSTQPAKMSCNRHPAAHAPVSRLISLEKEKTA